MSRLTAGLPDCLSQGSRQLCRAHCAQQTATGFIPGQLIPGQSLPAESSIWKIESSPPRKWSSSFLFVHTPRELDVFCNHVTSLIFKSRHKYYKFMFFLSYFIDFSNCFTFSGNAGFLMFSMMACSTSLSGMAKL